MKAVILTFLLAAVVAVTCLNTFLGSNVQRNQVYHHSAEYSSKVFRKRVENLYYALPPAYAGRSIQGILAYDRKNSEATANVTQGGLGYNFVNIRMKSERGRGLNYDIYIYA